MVLFAELEQRTLIFDGAMGTELIAAGYRSQECPEEWNLSHADVVAGIHRAYLEAGADIIETNTFGGSRSKLSAYDAGDRVAELNSAAARIAVSVRNEAGSGKLVAGDIGPSGRLLPPMGEASPGELQEVFAEQAEALVAGGVDLIGMTTFFDLGEATAAVKGVRATTGALPVIASMAFKRSPHGYRTMMGVTPAQAAEALLEAGATVVGANCEMTGEEMADLVTEFRAATDAPLIFQPNAGRPRLEGGRTVYGESPEHFAEVVSQLVARGAAVIGGCCGTTPRHISALVAALG
jgi:5-methyltetrahydrofolate--homocysteine methyltransferase